MERIGRQLRLVTFDERIIKMNGFAVIFLWALTLFVGIMIGSSYWFKTLFN